MTGGRAKLLLNLPQGSQLEEKVSNKEFLHSFIHYGSWLRVVTAHDQQRILNRPASGSTQIEKLAAVVAFYEAFGMLVEDVVTSLVAWAAWAKYPGRLLADLNEQIVLATGPQAKGGDKPYHIEAVELLATGKRARIDPRRFIASLIAMRPDELVQSLGVPWKPHPSVNLIPREERRKWEILPSSLLENLQSLADPKKQFLTTSYNKLKHGPQAVMADIRDVAVKKRGLNANSAKCVPEEVHVRLLFAGAETQETQNPETSDERTAPFLSHDIDHVDAMLFEVMLPLTLSIQLLALCLYRVVFRETPPENHDPRIEAIRKEAIKNFKETHGTATFGW